METDVAKCHIYVYIVIIRCHSLWQPKWGDPFVSIVVSIPIPPPTPILVTYDTSLMITVMLSTMFHE